MSDFNEEFNRLPPEIVHLTGEIALAEIRCEKLRRKLSDATDAMTRARDELTTALEELDIKRVELRDECHRYVKEKL